MAKRPAKVRGLFYTRDSGGEHETTPGEYIHWAGREAERLGVAFRGTPEQIERMIRDGRPHEGDVFLDYGVKGNRLDRPGLAALLRAAEEDRDVSRLFIPRRDRLARPDEAIDGLKLENGLRLNGLTLVFMERTLPALDRGGKRDVGELIVAMMDYAYAGAFRRDLAQKMIYAQMALARAGFSGGGRPTASAVGWPGRTARRSGSSRRASASAGPGTTSSGSPGPRGRGRSSAGSWRCSTPASRPAAWPPP